MKSIALRPARTLGAAIASHDNGFNLVRLVCATLVVVYHAYQFNTLRAAVDANPDDLRARHLLGAHAIVEGDPEAGLRQFMEMLRRNRAYEDGLPRKALIDAFRIVDDEDLVGRYRRQMSALLLS